MEVVVEQHSRQNEYYDLEKEDEIESEQLLTSYVDSNNELKLEMTDSGTSTSVESSNEKKAKMFLEKARDSSLSASSNSEEAASKKTFLTNLSGSVLKSEQDLLNVNNHQTEDQTKRRKSL